MLKYKIIKDILYKYVLLRLLSPIFFCRSDKKSRQYNFQTRLELIRMHLSNIVTKVIFFSVEPKPEKSDDVDAVLLVDDDGQLSTSTRDSSARSKNLRVPRYSCDICGKKVRKAAMLSVHLARAHGVGAEPFKCFICGLGTAFETAMRQHVESHLPYKRYRCPTCGQRYANQRYLNSHQSHDRCADLRRPRSG